MRQHSWLSSWYSPADSKIYLTSLWAIIGRNFFLNYFIVEYGYLVELLCRNWWPLVIRNASNQVQNLNVPWALRLPVFQNPRKPIHGSRRRRDPCVWWVPWPRFPICLILWHKLEFCLWENILKYNEFTIVQVNFVYYLNILGFVVFWYMNLLLYLNHYFFGMHFRVYDLWIFFLEIYYLLYLTLFRCILIKDIV